MSPEACKARKSDGAAWLKWCEMVWDRTAYPGPNFVKVGNLRGMRCNVAPCNELCSVVIQPPQRPTAGPLRIRNTRVHQAFQKVDINAQLAYHGGPLQPDHVSHSIQSNSAEKWAGRQKGRLREGLATKKSVCDRGQTLRGGRRPVKVAWIRVQRSLATRQGRPVPRASESPKKRVSPGTGARG